MKCVYIIGSGPGGQELLTVRAREVIERCGCVIAHERLLRDYTRDGRNGGAGTTLNKTVLECASPEGIAALVAQRDTDEAIAVLVSGDTGFYSLAKRLTELLRDDVRVELISGISVIAYFCARILSSWDDAVLLSLHGREGNVAEKVRRSRKVIMLTDACHTPAWIAGKLCEHGLGHVILTVGENLSYENERIVTAAAPEMRGEGFGPLCVVQAENPRPQEHLFICDGDFVRGDTPMTKQEVRCLSINKLRLTSRDVVYDVGAGTGSVAVEMALQMPEGRVFALERDEEALRLIRENKKKFGAANLVVVEGNAQDTLVSLPDPDKVFIGGSGGEMAAVLDRVYRKNPGVRVVMNAVTLETLCEVTQYYRARSGYVLEMVQAAVSSAREMGSYHLLTAQNPVFIICAARKEGIS